MDWLAPRGLWLLGLLAPLVALYILKVRRERRPVSSTWLWEAAERDLLARAPFRRLRAEIPLLLQLLALAALAAALARPAWETRLGAGTTLAVVLDTSASMQARVGDGPTRLEQARSAARELLASLPPGSEALVIEAGREARLASPLDRDPRRLAAAVERIESADTEGDLGAGVALAADRLRNVVGARRILVFTDAALARPLGLTALDVPTEVVQVGGPAENLAITRVDVRVGADATTRAEQVQVFALVVNHGDRPREAFATLRQRNVAEPLDSRRLTVGPRERVPLVLSFELAPGDAGSGLLVELSPGDALGVDDRAWLRVPPGRRQAVVMAPPGASPWLARALAADPDVELMTVALDKLAPADVPADALVVVTGACPSVTAGLDLVIVNPPPGRCRTLTVGAELDRPTITSWNTADARLRFLSLDGVDLSRARALATEGPEEALIRAREGVVAADVSDAGRTGTLLGFDPGDSSWPLKASFVLFARNLVEQTRAHRQRGVTGLGRTGDPLRVQVPAEVTEVTVQGPVGEPAKVPSRGGLVVVPETAHAGFYSVSWQGARPGSALLVANLLSDRESDLAPQELAVASGELTRSSVSEVARTHAEWGFALAALALVLVAADLAWLTRRPPRPALSSPRDGAGGPRGSAPPRPDRRPRGAP